MVQLHGQHTRQRSLQKQVKLLELPSVVRAYTTTKKHYDLHGGSYSNVTSEMKKIYLLKDLEREPLRYWKGNGKMTFTKPFLILGKVTFDKHVNVLERYCKCGISYTFTKP